MLQKNKIFFNIFILIIIIGIFAYIFIYLPYTQSDSSASYQMSTIITQTVYGKNKDKAINEVNSALADFENELSLFLKTSEIALINENAGISAVKVSDETYDIIKKAVDFSKNSDNAFAITIAPLTKEWGITTDAPKVPSDRKIDELLSLVDDNSIIFDDKEKTIFLPIKGQSIDLGGIAKGYACEIAKNIYSENDVTGAVISIGGNTYAYKTKPFNKEFLTGFRDPKGTEYSYIASLTQTDKVLSVSGGYERFFEEDGVKYHHILSLVTGYPADSDIVCVGVMTSDGAKADFLSTTLFIWGKDKTLEYMKTCDEEIIMLSEDNNIYISSSLENTFTLNGNIKNEYTLNFVKKES